MTISWFYTCMKWKHGWNSEKCAENTDRPRLNKNKKCSVFLERKLKMIFFWEKWKNVKFSLKYRLKITENSYLQLMKNDHDL